MLLHTDSTHNGKGTNSHVVKMTQPAEIKQLMCLATIVLAQWIYEQSGYGSKDGGSGGIDRKAWAPIYQG